MEETKVERAGNWMTTVSGGRFWPMDPRPEDVRIVDIAHALSNICRFGGHVRAFYSVAQHSVLVSELVLTVAAARWAILHDAAEAYTGDMIRPLKSMLPHWRQVEAPVQAAVAERFGLPPSIPAEVLIADEIALATEARDLMPAGRILFEIPGKPDPMQEVVPLPPQAARARFMARFRELFPGYEDGGPAL